MAFVWSRCDIWRKTQCSDGHAGNAGADEKDMTIMEKLCFLFEAKPISIWLDLHFVCMRLTFWGFGCTDFLLQFNSRVTIDGQLSNIFCLLQNLDVSKVSILSFTLDNQSQYEYMQKLVYIPKEASHRNTNICGSRVLRYPAKSLHPLCTHAIVIMEYCPSSLGCIRKGTFG
jgi:hypothetical protein